MGITKQTILGTAAGLTLGVILGAAGICHAKHGSAPDSLIPPPTRELKMIYNLEHGPKSARFYLAESIKSTRVIERDLDNALKQVQCVDAAYGKARNRPDESALNASVKHLSAATQTAHQLADQILLSAEELSADVQETMGK